MYLKFKYIMEQWTTSDAAIALTSRHSENVCMAV